MRKIDITTQIWRKGRCFLAYCPELDFISQGKTLYEAKKNLMEVAEIQFEEMSKKGTLYDYLAECGFKIGKKINIDREFVGFERTSYKVAV
ncbi:MAG: type II toxin-antitoxin system HicB family antitoxin [bacterium]|nr:type II toxin-antitoxin system HicB family antitoxin [bacterium]